MTDWLRCFLDNLQRAVDTALRDINELLLWRVLRKIPGDGRSTAYQLNTQGRLADHKEGDSSSLTSQ